MPLDSLQFDLNWVRVPKARRQGSDQQQLPGLVVCPFTIICDSREQLPYEFSGMEWGAGETCVVPTVVRGLAQGDYSIQGLEDRIAIERKSLDDLYGSVTWGRDRFEAEVGRLNTLAGQNDPEPFIEAWLPPGGFAAVVIEATWPEIMAPAGHRPGWINQTEPRSVVATVLAWSMRYHRVHWITAGDRRHAEIITFGILQRFWKESKP